jgi:hypothetical protein
MLHPMDQPHQQLGRAVLEHCASRATDTRERKGVIKLVWVNCCMADAGLPARWLSRKPTTEGAVPPGARRPHRLMGGQ